MTATQTQFRRGTSAQCEGMTPAEGECVVDLTNDTWRVGDGSRAGGFIVPNFNHIQTQTFQFAVAGGTSNALTLALSPAPLSYSQPLKAKFRASNTNTGATTIDINSLGVKNIQKMSGGSLSALTAGDIVSGGIYEIVYDGVQFQLLTITGAGVVSVGQGDLRTSSGTFSLSANLAVSGNFRVSNAGTTLPGGSYGFSLENYGAGTLSGFFYGGTNVSYTASVVCWTNSGATDTIFGRQRFITSSPPYNLGDGDVGGFIYLLVDENNNAIAHYASDTPPWAYNGPTDIRATHKCPITNKKYRITPKQLSVRDIINGKKIEYEKQEITNDIKNADMNLIPHPFTNVPEGHRVILLDPMSDKISRLIELQNSGSNEVQEIINNYIKIDSDKINRKCHQSVTAVKFKLKGESNG